MPGKKIPLIHAKKTPQKDVMLDTEGFFVIELIKNQEIQVEYYSNVFKNNKIVSGILEMVFVGTKADALSDSIAQYISTLRHEHYLYLGRELQKAQYALEHHQSYEQGGC
ncbi:MAG: DUF4346 domain-containing protein [Candidatus Thermoplasmatota archaeon]|nr:DUF4346 domain-containing protein [Candidatus Thermoplasmatota archaeon]MBU1940946.1 DUF4346 domain-containing protein [Candidatus Thermoplasmatota archaeon]